MMFRSYPLFFTFFIHIVSGQTTYSCNSNASCGCSANSATLTRIVAGEAANTNTWGWIVSILINGNTQCGGSIIDSSWVLTAAHCVATGTRSVSIYAGSTSRFSGSQIVSVERVYRHTGYDSRTFVNDIALLQLASPLNLNDPGVDTICLPVVTGVNLTAVEWPNPGTTVVAIGWGRLYENAPTSSSTLQQVTLATVARTHASCAPILPDWRLQLCAGVIGDNRSTCQGDSGGPLMMFNQTWTLIGITSYGVGCGRTNYSGGYTRVAYYLDWIASAKSGNEWSFKPVISASAVPLQYGFCMSIVRLVFTRYVRLTTD